MQYLPFSSPQEFLQTTNFFRSTSEEDHGCQLTVHRGLWWSRDASAAKEGPLTGSGRCSKIPVIPWKDNVGSKRLQEGPVNPWREEPTLDHVFWQDLWPGRGPVLELILPEGLASYGRDPCWNGSWVTSACGSTHTGEIHKGLFPLWKGKSVKNQWEVGRLSSKCCIQSLECHCFLECIRIYCRAQGTRLTACGSRWCHPSSC